MVTMSAFEQEVISVLASWGIVGNRGLVLAGDIRWQAVFFMGLGGSGKSTVRVQRYMRNMDFAVIDPDEIKKRHPDYDPENPGRVHEWSRDVADSEFRRTVTDGTGKPVLVDGTGVHVDRILRKMELAKDNGYQVHLVYVYAPLEVALWRNRNRTRYIPEEVILSQHANMDRAFATLRAAADRFRVIPNYTAEEMKRAKLDMEAYPPPQRVRPPRPGDAGYGRVLASSLGSPLRKRRDYGEDGHVFGLAAGLIRIAEIVLAENPRLKPVMERGKGEWERQQKERDRYVDRAVKSALAERAASHRVAKPIVEFEDMGERPGSLADVFGDLNNLAFNLGIAS